MTLRDPRTPDEQVLDIARIGLVGGAIAAVVLLVAAIRSWGSGLSVVLLVIAVVLGLAVFLVGRRLLRD